MTTKEFISAPRGKKRHKGMTYSEASVCEALKSDGVKVIKGGWPDFLCDKNGKMFCVEVKTYQDKPTRLQLDIINVLKKHGIETHVVSDGYCADLGGQIYESGRRHYGRGFNRNRIGQWNLPVPPVVIPNE